MRRSKKTPKLRATALCVGNPPMTGEFRTQRVSEAKLCEGNSPETGEFPAPRASKTEIASIWYVHVIYEAPIMIPFGNGIAIWRHFCLGVSDLSGRYMDVVTLFKIRSFNFLCTHCWSHCWFVVYQRKNKYLLNVLTYNIVYQVDIERKKCQLASWTSVGDIYIYIYIYI